MGTLVQILALSWPLGSNPRDRQPCKVGFLVIASKTKESLSKEQTGGEGRCEESQEEAMIQSHPKPLAPGSRYPRLMSGHWGHTGHKERIRISSRSLEQKTRAAQRSDLMSTEEPGVGAPATCCSRLWSGWSPAATFHMDPRGES